MLPLLQEAIEGSCRVWRLWLHSTLEITTAQLGIHQTVSSVLLQQSAQAHSLFPPQSSIKLQERALRKDDLKEVDMDKVVEGWHKWSPRILRYRWRMLYDTFVRDLNGGDEEVDYDRNLKGRPSVDICDYRAHTDDFFYAHS
jgi:hypothetical protein